jgi:hypothetical protein
VGTAKRAPPRCRVSHRSCGVPPSGRCRRHRRSVMKCVALPIPISSKIRAVDCMPVATDAVEKNHTGRSPNTTTTHRCRKRMICVYVCVVTIVDVLEHTRCCISVVVRWRPQQCARQVRPLYTIALNTRDEFAAGGFFLGPESSLF